MRASTKARYGLRALLYLAEQGPGRMVPVREISEKESVSADYLEHLLHTMKAAGLVESARGAAGGFRLAKAADEISLKDVFASLEERINPVWCIGPGERCPRERECRSRPMWDRFARIIEKFLSETTIADALSTAFRK